MSKHTHPLATEDLAQLDQLWGDLTLHGISIMQEGKRIDPQDFIAAAEYDCKYLPGERLEL